MRLAGKMARNGHKHSSMVAYLAQVIYEKNYPTTFYCIIASILVPMTTTQNIRVCLWGFYETLFS
jgi:hypothetical protein